MEPVNLVIPNTVAEKMATIRALAEAVATLAVALESVSVNVTISGNEIHCVENGIKVELDEYRGNGIY